VGCAAVVLVWRPVFEAVVARAPCIFHGVISTGIKFDEMYTVVKRVLVVVKRQGTGGLPAVGMLSVREIWMDAICSQEPEGFRALCSLRRSCWLGCRVLAL